MGSLFNNFGQYLFIIVGVICVVRGIITITTGKVPASELSKLEGISENGLRKYKILSSVVNIVGGLLCVAISVVKMVGIVQPTLFKLISILILIIIIVAFVILRNACKKAE